MRRGSCSAELAMGAMSRMGKASFNFEGKRVLVTGGSSGIGLAIAQGFLDSKADVWITGTRGAAAEYDSPSELDGLTYRQLDVKDGEAVQRLALELVSIYVLKNHSML